MERLLKICLATFMLAMATAQTVLPANFTASTADLQNDDSIKLSVSQDDKMVPMASVLGVTNKAKTGIPPPGLSDTVVIANPSNQDSLQSNQIALISCDTYSGFLGAIDVFQSAITANVTAVLFYTTQQEYCNLQDFAVTYPWIFTMKSASESSDLVKAVNDDNGPVYATIGDLDMRVVNGTGPQTPSPPNAGASSKNPLGPSPTTAVAMIILYAITGVITLLFLVIIITGAFRAHRHPERYGPRNGGILGRARQSRARGLARAMLDTLPIVKFGEREEPKPADVELANTTATTTEPRDTNNAENQQSDATDLTRRQSAENGIAAATTTANDDTFANPDHIGCSICTEDFETGQDQRVLPCDHRFHPECIDPWLLNVSGTCFFGVPYETCPDRASSIRFFSLRSICSNFFDTFFPSSFESDACRNHSGKSFSADLVALEGCLIGICPTPPIRSMFWRMLPKKGFCGLSVNGIGHPPTTGATSGPSVSTDSFVASLSPAASMPASTYFGKRQANSCKPPLMIYNVPSYPSLRNFFVVLTHVWASLSVQDDAS